MNGCGCVPAPLCEREIVICLYVLIALLCMYAYFIINCQLHMYAYFIIVNLQWGGVGKTTWYLCFISGIWLLFHNRRFISYKILQEHLVFITNAEWNLSVWFKLELMEVLCLLHKIALVFEAGFCQEFILLNFNNYFPT